MVHPFLPPNINNQRIFVLWWRVSQWAFVQPDFATILSPDETRRANRFISDLVRTRFIIGRGLMRHILGHYTKQQPQTLTFRYGSRGKPLLDNTNFSFNLSHSEDVMLLALAMSATIGVDVEHLTPMTEMRRVAGDYFSVNEQIALFSLPPEAQLSAFYRCWTRKEAYIKARGDGFALPLDKFDVTLKPDEPPCLLRTLDDDHPDKWRFFHLDPTDAYMGAVCLPNGDWTLEMYQLTPSS